jgi:hypothetical protein
MDTDKRIARQLLNEQGFDVDEERIYIPSKRSVENVKHNEADKQQAQHTQRLVTD